MLNKFEQRKQSFLTGAEAYQQYRASYPSTLVHEIEAYGRLQPSSRVLEFGCGTGQLTRLLSSQKWQVIATDPSQDMLNVAKKNSLQVDYACVSFEDFNSPYKFNLVAAATAYHWFNKEIRLQKISDLLLPDGVLAVIVNVDDYENDQQPIRKEANQIYANVWQSVNQKQVRPLLERYEEIWQEIQESKIFTQVKRLTLPNPKTFNAEAYLGLMQTHSDTKTMPTEAKQALLKGVAKVFEKYGGEVTIPYQTWCFLAKKSA